MTPALGSGYPTQSRLLRPLALLGALGVAGWASAARIILIPLDDRPACSQFAQMIGRIAQTQVQTPPKEYLGHFTSPGQPERILTWLEMQDLSDVTALVASVDMVCYGGLIASRVNDVPEQKANERLDRLAAIKKRYPGLWAFAFGATMRLAPTGLKSNRTWRDDLARLMELESMKTDAGRPAVSKEIIALRQRVPAGPQLAYRETRARNHNVQRHAIHMAVSGAFDYVVMGQDDAREHGPHNAETRALVAMTKRLGVDAKVYFFEGVDQLSSLLVSRVILRRSGWMPHVRIVYSDERLKTRLAPYEAKPIELSLRDQLLASGARVAGPNEVYDYSLYVNVPKARSDAFKAFLEDLKHEIDEGLPVGVADIDLQYNGAGRKEVVDALRDGGRLSRILSYAGWNTAGNTMGTAIPASNVYLLARRQNRSPLLREVAQNEFLLHRFVNDFVYHSYTRPIAYALLDTESGLFREQADPKTLQELNTIVRNDLNKRLLTYYRDYFAGKRFFVGTDEYEYAGLEDVKIELPWPRAYEVRLEFRLVTKPVAVAATQVSGGG